MVSAKSRSFITLTRKRLERYRLISVEMISVWRVACAHCIYGRFGFRCRTTTRPVPHGDYMFSCVGYRDAIDKGNKMLQRSSYFSGNLLRSIAVAAPPYQTDAIVQSFRDQHKVISLASAERARIVPGLTFGRMHLLTLSNLRSVVNHLHHPFFDWHAACLIFDAGIPSIYKRRSAQGYEGGRSPRLAKL